MTPEQELAKRLREYADGIREMTHAELALTIEALAATIERLASEKAEIEESNAAQDRDIAELTHANTMLVNRAEAAEAALAATPSATAKAEMPEWARSIQGCLMAMRRTLRNRYINSEEKTKLIEPKVAEALALLPQPETAKAPNAN